jgi:predicted protein tyrosine phosphatase
MEKQHQRKLSQNSAAYLRGKRVIRLGIPDDYGLMQPELIEAIEAKAAKFLL